MSILSIYFLATSLTKKIPGKNQIHRRVCYGVILSVLCNTKEIEFKKVSFVKCKMLIIHKRSRCMKLILSSTT